METLPNLTETDTKQSLPTTSIYTPPILVSEADHVDARIGEFFQAVVPEWPYSTSSSSSSSFPLSSTQMCDEKSTEEAISTANWCLHKRRHSLIRQTDDELFSSFSSTISSSSSSLVTAPIETLSVQDRLLSEVS